MIDKNSIKKVFSRSVAATIAGLIICVSIFAQGTANITVSNEVVGKTPTLIGYGQGHYMPGSNVSAWLKRSDVNSLRIFMNAAYFAPQDDLAPFGDGVSDSASFEARRSAIIADPENPAYVNWVYYENNFQNVETSGNHYKLAYMMSELQRLGIKPIINTQHCNVSNATSATNPRDWRNVPHNPSWMPISIYNNYADKWEFWKWHFVTAYWLAKNYNVTDYQIWNEPDHIEIGGNINQDDYVQWIRYGSDAKRAAIQAVNQRFGKNLTAKIYAPVITSPKAFQERLDNADTRDDVIGWGEKISRSLRTDYRGQTVSYNIFDVFDTHRYDDDASVYYDDMITMQSGMAANSPGGIVLPINFSEHNVENTSGFAASGNNLNMPRLFSELGLVYAKLMLKGVYGTQTFKYSNVNDAGVGHHYTWDNAANNYDTGGYRKSASVVQLFAKGFKDARDRYKTMTSASPTGYGGAYTSFDGANYYVWAVNTDATNSYSLNINMYGLGIYTNTLCTTEETSVDRNGEVVRRTPMPSDKILRLTQPPQSVWLITIPKGGILTTQTLTATADAQVQGGTSANTNFGLDTSMRVKKYSSVDSDRISYLKFDLNSLGRTSIKQAIINVYGRNAIDTENYAFHVYGITDDSWSESAITWNNSPNHDLASANAAGVGTTAFPLGVLTVNGTNGNARLDVTDFVNEQFAGNRLVSFMLIREYKYDGDTGDNTRHALLNTRKATTNKPVLEIDY
ncbi:MAG: DNRLRE domain-containing protein [Acidobacteria bacterium]|nr:DNRLRE domain-containing protein [Acidobacteriota bacterium]MCA1639103.1 DNRLRE domain-containing protein [Acidobacteriota bacterium]